MDPVWQWAAGVVDRVLVSESGLSLDFGFVSLSSLLKAEERRGLVGLITEVEEEAEEREDLASVLVQSASGFRFLLVN